MELLCEKCRQLVETEQCPYCGSTETREPESGDPCYLAKTDGPGTAVLSGMLEKKGIPFRTRTIHTGKYNLYHIFYVPYGRADDAWQVMHEIWGDDEPVTDERNEGNGSELFDAEEIDRMEAAMLDDMDLEELKAYKSRIMKTLKEIKVQEQKWKQRTNILLDMKEEAENLIDDLS